MHDGDGTKPNHPSADDDKAGGAAEAGANEPRSSMSADGYVAGSAADDDSSDQMDQSRAEDPVDPTERAADAEGWDDSDGLVGDDAGITESEFGPEPETHHTTDGDVSDTESDGGSGLTTNLSGSGAFRDSGSFFRDGVARSLAEQYGLRIDENGRPIDSGVADADSDTDAEPTAGSVDEDAGSALSDPYPGTQPFPAVGEHPESSGSDPWGGTDAFTGAAAGSEPTFSYPDVPAREPHEEPYSSPSMDPFGSGSFSDGSTEANSPDDPFRSAASGGYPGNTADEGPGYRDTSYLAPSYGDTSYGATAYEDSSYSGAGYGDSPYADTSNADTSYGDTTGWGGASEDDTSTPSADNDRDPFEAHRSESVPDFGDPTGAGATGTFSALSPGVTGGYVAGGGAGGTTPPGGPPSGPPAIIPPGAGDPNEPSGPQEVAEHPAGEIEHKPTKSAVARKRSAVKKKKRKKKRPLWFRLARVALISVFGIVLLGLGAFGTAYALIEVPDATQEGATDQGSTFYYGDGESEFLERGTDRQPVDLDDVPEHVQDAVLAAEDHGFWTEPGVSLRGTGRALWVTLTSRVTGVEETQGGSTITQQMVRNYYEGLSQEQTIDRKLQEIVIALKVDQQQDKEWILEQYLNTIYMGRQAFGIQAAAEAYFDKDVSELTTEEATYLAAAIQQPHTFGTVDEDNQENLGALEGRWNAVMDHMSELGWMDEETLEADSVADAEIPLAQSAARDEELTGHTGYMWQQVMSELEALGYTEEDLDTGAYEIVTTFDEDMMTAAEEAVEQVVPVDNLPDGVRAGLTAVDPSTGEVVAFYGGPGYEFDNYDSAFRGSAQAGSAIKPYVLAAALEQGIGLNTVIDASSPQTFEGSTVQNAGGGSYPRVNLVEATARSVNTGYINLLQQAGQENVVNMMHEAGIPDDKITEEQALAPTLALGVSDVSPVDQASGFATFANRGEHIEPHVVRSIINRDGDDERPAPERNQAMSENTAADVTHALQRVVSSGTGTRASIGRPSAGKTGTTDSSVAAWFVGYTPQLSGAVGIYNGENQPFSMPGYGSLSGGTMPADVWRTFMSNALEGEDVEEFPGPSGQGSTHDWGGAEPEPSPDDEDGDEPDDEPEREGNGAGEEEETPAPEEPPEEEPEEMPEVPDRDTPEDQETLAQDQYAPGPRERD